MYIRHQFPAPSFLPLQSSIECGIEERRIVANEVLADLEAFCLVFKCNVDVDDRLWVAVQEISCQQTRMRCCPNEQQVG